jgi:hypothetical protein
MLLLLSIVDLITTSNIAAAVAINFITILAFVITPDATAGPSSSDSAYDYASRKRLRESNSEV